MKAIQAENKIQPIVLDAFDVTSNRKIPTATERIKHILEKKEILKVSELADFAFIVEVTYF